MLPASPLCHRLNTASRSHHTHLNHLITTLLPLALPPHNTTPHLYIHGMLSILAIYEALEKSFREVLVQRQQWCEYGNGDGDEGKDEDRHRQLQILEALQKLHIPSLERAPRLRADISTLQRRFGKCSESLPQGPNLHSSMLKAYIQSITSSITPVPRPGNHGQRYHLLLAPLYIFYMALFSGGRYIRSPLFSAGPSFWNTNNNNNDLDGRRNSKGIETDEENVLSFWSFSGNADGEDLKEDFKMRFGEVEAALTEGEKEEVVKEGVRIMEALIDVVEEIQGEVGGTG